MTSAPTPRRFKVEKLRRAPFEDMWNVYDRKTRRNYKLYFWPSALRIIDAILKGNH